jgi:hypothetical protein
VMLAWRRIGESVESVDKEAGRRDRVGYKEGKGGSGRKEGR